MSTNSGQTIRIALLLDDTPLPAVQESHGTYLDIYTAFLKDVLSSYPDPEAVEGINLVVDGFDVVNEGVYPSEDALKNDYDCVMLTGSAHTSYESVPWIDKLVSFLSDLATQPHFQHLKIIGICFGLQVLARALGGTCERCPDGWEIGVYDVELTEDGKRLVEMIPIPKVDENGVSNADQKRQQEYERRILAEIDERKIISIQQFHRDYVSSLPPNTTLIGSSSKCPIQGFIRYREQSDSQDSESSEPRIHILAYQGHPEFTEPIVTIMVDVRAEKGVLDAETTKEARRRVGRVAGGEGRGVIGWGIIKMLLQD